MKSDYDRLRAANLINMDHQKEFILQLAQKSGYIKWNLIYWCFHLQSGDFVWGVGQDFFVDYTCTKFSLRMFLQFRKFMGAVQIIGTKNRRFLQGYHDHSQYDLRLTL